MIDTAYIIGQIGKAIYHENGRYFVVGVESPNEPLECRSGDISLLLDCSADVLSISPQDLNLSRIEDILGERTLCHKALALVLSGLDEELSQTSRSISIEAVESLLEQESVLRFLRARMLARALPPEADLRGALSLANASGATRVASFYAVVEQTQKAIQRLTEAWSETSLILSLTDAEQVEIESNLIDAGVFADIAFTIAVGDEVRVRSTIANTALRSEVRSLTRSAQVLNTLQHQLLGASANEVEIIKEIETTHGKQADADLILKLYDLRREPVMREARNWFFSFNPTSTVEYMDAMMGEHSGHLRMVISYWDMAASFVNNGAIDEQMFNDANGEHLFIFAKIEPILDDLREQWNQPDMLRNFERLVRRVPNNKEILAGIRERIRLIQSLMAEQGRAHAFARG